LTQRMKLTLKPRRSLEQLITELNEVVVFSGPTSIEWFTIFSSSAN
jgi:hypothetical protein